MAPAHYQHRFTGRREDAEMFRLPLLATAFLLLSLPASALVFPPSHPTVNVQLEPLQEFDELIDFDETPDRKINMSMMRLTDS
jgi:hypothetical protein